eukprot:gene7519-9016_t
MFGRSDWTYQDVFLSDWDSTWSHLGFRVIGAAQAASVTTGFRIIGAEANHMLGISISSAGDFNEDGCGDMIVSTPTGPTRGPTGRPSRLKTITAAPSAADSIGNEVDLLPTAEGESAQGGFTTESIVIAASAAGGVIGFGCIAIMLCAACSYKLRKDREKCVERRTTLHPSKDISTTTPEARRIETQKVSNGTLQSAPKTTAQGSTQRTITCDSITAVRLAHVPEESPSQSVDANSVSDSSLELSSLHSSELNDTEYYFTGVVKGSRSNKIGTSFVGDGSAARA